MKSLRRFGFYETYPQWHSDCWTPFAMKFSTDRPIVFALSSNPPRRYRNAVRDGILYWNRALGKSLLRVIDAPPDVRAPSPDYNIVQWARSRRPHTFKVTRSLGRFCTHTSSSCPRR